MRFLATAFLVFILNNAAMACQLGGASYYTFPAPPLERAADIIVEASVGKIEKVIRNHQMGKREVASVFSKIRFDISNMIRGRIDTQYVDVYFQHAGCGSVIPKIGEHAFLAGTMGVSFLGEPILLPLARWVPWAKIRE